MTVVAVTMAVAWAHDVSVGSKAFSGDRCKDGHIVVEGITLGGLGWLKRDCGSRATTSRGGEEGVAMACYGGSKADSWWEKD